MMNALKINSLLFLIFSFTGIFAQNTITGKVLQEKTMQAVPFATIRILNTSNGVSADVNGIFKLKLNTQNHNDTLLFAGLGFMQRKIALGSFKSPFEVYLQEDVKTLNEVSIDNKRKEIQIGSFNTASDVMNLNFGYEHAKRFEMPKTHQYLKEIIILRDLEFFPFSTETKFRINIYDENPVTRGPGMKICQDVIEVSDLNHNQVKVNVSKHNISINSSTFFVSIETLRIPYNERYRVSRPDVFVDGIPQYPAYFEVCYQPILSVAHSKDNDGWILAPWLDKNWKTYWLVPAIKIVVN